MHLHFSHLEDALIQSDLLEQLWLYALLKGTWTDWFESPSQLHEQRLFSYCLLTARLQSLLMTNPFHFGTFHGFYPCLKYSTNVLLSHLLLLHRYYFYNWKNDQSK
jgi:hypothetical protein